MNFLENNGVNQSGAVAGGDNVGGNKTHIGDVKIYAGRNATKIEILMQRLVKEKENNQHIKNMIDSLQHYHQRVSMDGIDGLENKLRHSGREKMLIKALMQKEAFMKTQDNFRHFQSAQEIFALLLSKIESCFDVEIGDLLDSADIAEINRVTKEKIVDPIMLEISDDVMGLNYNHVYGMIYWLAEQCFIRWHK